VPVNGASDGTKFGKQLRLMKQTTCPIRFEAESPQLASGGRTGAEQQAHHRHDTVLAALSEPTRSASPFSYLGDRLRRFCGARLLADGFSLDSIEFVT